MTVENFIYEIKNSNEMKYQYLPIWMVDSKNISHVIMGKILGYMLHTENHEILTVTLYFWPLKFEFEFEFLTVENIKNLFF